MTLIRARIQRLFRTLAAAAVLWPVALSGAVADGSVTVFAASSLTDVLTTVRIAYERRTGHTVRISFAASSALARQIERGAPADMFVSANVAWIDRLVDRGFARSEDTAVIAENALVVVAPGPDGADAVDLSPDFDVLGGLGPDGRLSIADPAHVPAGIYARQALETVGIWARVVQRLAISGNVRAALHLVERGEVPLGIVYRTDAASSNAVHVVARVPAAAHDPIRYRLAVVARSPAATAFRDFLLGREGRAILGGAGFVVADD